MGAKRGRRRIEVRASALRDLALPAASLALESNAIRSVPRSGLLRGTAVGAQPADQLIAERQPVR